MWKINLFLNFESQNNFGSCSFNEITLYIKKLIDELYVYILIPKKGKIWFLGRKHKPNHFFHEVHYMFTHMDNNYQSLEACHKNIGALEIKSLNLFLHLAEAFKFI